MSDEIMSEKMSLKMKNIYVGKMRHTSERCPSLCHWVEEITDVHVNVTSVYDPLPWSEHMNEKKKKNTIVWD